MAKYAKDVNKNVKIIDIQKQFPGGLKTVDTDDALGQVYLREAENVSLSEFSFLEKRFGLSEQEEFNFLQAFPNTERIQGYFEYTKKDGGVDKILFADGDVFIKTSDQSAYEKVDFFISEFGSGFNYPPQSDLEEVFTVDFYQAEDGPMALPGILTVEDNVGVLEVAVVNRDFQDAILEYSIDGAAGVETSTLEYEEQFVIPNFPVPTENNPVEIEVIAKDPNDFRDDSAIATQIFEVYRLITATFDVDGGTPTLDPVTIGSSGSLYIENPAIATPLTKEGFVLAGWDPTLPRSIDEDTTFEAQWSLGEFVIQFDSNGGTYVEPQTYFFGETTTAPTEPTLTDRQFDGWFIDTDFTTEFEFGDPIPDEDITLFAKWSNKTATPTVSSTYEVSEFPGRYAVNFTNNENASVDISFRVEELETGALISEETITGVGAGQTVSSYPTWNGFFLCGSEGRAIMKNIIAQASGKDPSDPGTERTFFKAC